MDREVYDVQLRLIFSLAVLVRQIKIEEVLKAMNKAELVAPIVDPTLWLRACGSLQWQKRVAEAALCFQRVVGEVEAEMVGNDEGE